MSPDPWKRPSAVDDAANVMSGYEQQLELQLNATVDATPEQINEWQEKELNWWAEIQLPLVAFMAFVQLAVFGGMLLTMILIGEGFK
jgi:hypothetical protein|tara:strand:+ start:441 stop:701 length:261 start_codon:yes stop_codon:yes gene_type:complete